MYTDEDLDNAIRREIFTADSVSAFRKMMQEEKSTNIVDEENFRLLTGFNDIFVVIACVLFLASSAWLLSYINNTVGLFGLALFSWALAEFFILKKRMALPAIVLLLAFVGGVFAFVHSALISFPDLSKFVAAGAAAIAAYAHWLRFRVPITVAAGTASAIGFIVLLLEAYFSVGQPLTHFVLILCGVFTFILAMYWDISDLHRTTHRSDVAFWLHLLSAPLIIHSVFSNMGILSGNSSIASNAVVIVLFILLTLVSIMIDRRALMVSALIYVLYALANLYERSGLASYALVATFFILGIVLLWFSAFWKPVRETVFRFLPPQIQLRIPSPHRV